MAFKLPKNIEDEAIQALKATASTDPVTALAAQKALAASLVEPLRKGIFDEDNLVAGTGRIFTEQVLAPGAQANYQLDFVRPGTEDVDFMATVMPKQGSVAQRQVEGDELWVPTYTISNGISWSLNYARDSRWDVVARAVEVLRAGYVHKINQDGWHTVLSLVDARNLVVSDSAAAVGQFTKELISKMKTAMTRNAGGNGQSGKLTDVYTSMEAVEDIRAWDESEIDEVTRREILQSAGTNMMKLYGVTIHAMTEFGVGQEYQNYLVNVLGRAVPAQEQEFVVGLDNSTNDCFIMPIREQLAVFDNPLLHMQRKAGLYSWMELGFAALDSRRGLLGTF